MKIKFISLYTHKLVFGSLFVVTLIAVFGCFHQSTVHAASINFTSSLWSTSVGDKPTIDGVVSDQVFPVTGIVSDLQPGGSYFVENSTLNDSVGATQNDGRGVWMPLSIPECATGTNIVFDINDRVAASASIDYSGSHVFAYGIVQDTDGTGPIAANILAAFGEPSPNVPNTSLPQSITGLTSGNINPPSNTGLYAIIILETNKMGKQLEWQIDGATITVTYEDSQCNPSTPIATPEATTTPLGTAVTYNVLSNDSDPENDTLTVTSASITSGDTGGSVSFSSDGNITYTPSASFTGTTIITYTISDGNGGTASSTLSVTITAAGVPNTGYGGSRDQKTSPLTYIMSILCIATLFSGVYNWQD